MFGCAKAGVPKLFIRVLMYTVLSSVECPFGSPFCLSFVALRLQWCMVIRDVIIIIIIIIIITSIERYCDPSCLFVCLFVRSLLCSLVRIRLQWQAGCAAGVWRRWRHTSAFYRAMHFRAKSSLAIACRPSVRPSVCLSVTLVDCDHVGCKYWKLIAQTISPTTSLFVVKRRSTYSHGNMGKFWGD